MGHLRILAAACLSAWAAGCGGDDSGVGTTYPVAGQVTLDNVPLKAEVGNVLFKPDRSKGNDSAFEPVGKIDPEGNYTLSTNGKAGAPPGWYKVIVTAHDGKLNRNPNRPPTPTALVPPQYGTPETTDLSVEVVESPGTGAYDLKLTQ
jgi:hypothetical protein